MDFVSFSAAFQIHYELNNLFPYLLISPRIDQFLNQDSELDLPVNIENKTIPGINVGIGIGYKVSNFIISCEIQKLYDLAHLAKTEGVELKNKTLIIAMGLNWDIRKSINLSSI